MPAASGGLPVDLVFLESFGIHRDVLWSAAARAAWDGIDGRRALLAEGRVSEAFYYHALASYLGVPFEGSWPHPVQPIDLRDALARGWARMAGAEPTWLSAPRTPDIGLLVKAHSLGLPMPRMAITTPSHFAAVLCHRSQTSIAQRASLALPRIAPRLSASRALTVPAVGAIGAGVLALLGGIGCGSHIESDVLGLVFLAGLAFRLLVYGEGLQPRSPPEHARTPISALPTYSVLVPLHDEAEMVPHLVASLAALDYPVAKREVLFLVESDDSPTRAALSAQRLPAGFRIVDLPPGAPRTKPRALNVGLFLATGDLVTIYDAEDRPEPDQLRRAAARFAHATDDLACLQASLAITNGEAGLLTQLFALEYAALFDVFNIGLARLGLPIALGGTSNHFRGMG